MTDRYPFYSYFSDAAEKACSSAGFAFLDEECEPSLELVGVLYMRTMVSKVALSADYSVDIDKGDRRRLFGEFYTPAWLAEKCIQEPLSKDLLSLINEVRRSSHNQLSSFRLLDPACGAGNFLVAALRLCRKIFSDVGYGEPSGESVKLASARCNELLLDFARNCLFGIDIDQKAISLSHFVLVLALAELLGEPDNVEYWLGDVVSGFREHIRCGDAPSLAPIAGNAPGPGPIKGDAPGLGPIEGDAPSPGPIKREAYCLRSGPDSKFRDFDFVVTNPPYISYGARNQPPLHAGLARYLRTSFPSSSEYKIRLHSIFQELGVRLCRAGGTVIMLVPDAFLSGAYYAKLRQYLLQNCRIVSLSELPERTFKDAVAGRWCIAEYQPREKGSVMAVGEVVKLARMEAPAKSNGSLEPEHWHEQTFFIDTVRLVSRDKSRFEMVFDELDARLLHKMRALDPVSSKYKGYTGIRSRLGQAAIIGDKPGAKDGNWRRGIISGANVMPHKVTWTDKWIDVSAEKLFAGGFDPNIVENPKLLVRQTGDRLVGAVDESGLYHLNNVHSFAATKDWCKTAGRQARIDVTFYLGALLNSSLWLYLYQLKSREVQRALAQIDIEMVEALPLPNGFGGEFYSELIQLAMYRASGRVADSSDSCRAARIDRAIDRLVYCSYGLKDDEIAHIEERISFKYISKRAEKRGAEGLPAASEQEAIPALRHVPAGSYLPSRSEAFELLELALANSQ